MKSFEQLVDVIPAGRYVLAVSGGVDSVVLLEVLAKRPELELIVAHFDHGIRKYSQQDRNFVQQLSMSHNLGFEFKEVTLGASTSEAKARKYRYDFLRQVCNKYNALGMILAHHRDDQLETAIINLLRGTGRRGLSSLRSHDTIIRPMLRATKANIVTYATQHNLQWHEDFTNNDQSYLRNYVRHSILAVATPTLKKNLQQIIVRQEMFNILIDKDIQAWLKENNNDSPATLPRYSLIMLPSVVAEEILQAVCKQITGKTVEYELLCRMLLFAKTAAPGKQFLLNNQWRLRLTRREVIVELRSPVVS